MNNISLLKSLGLRITSQRKSILEALAYSPLTPIELFKKLKSKKASVDLASVYRTLELLTKINIIEAVEFGDGVKRYELFDKDNHHHHLICDHCGKIQDLNLASEIKILNEVKETTKFQIKRHSMEFFGLCSKCFL